MVCHSPDFLTRDQFVSLLMVGDEQPDRLDPIIPMDHEILLIRLAYIAKLHGRLRMTTAGRARISEPRNFTIMEPEQATAKVELHP